MSGQHDRTPSGRRSLGVAATACDERADGSPRGRGARAGRSYHGHEGVAFRQSAFDFADRAMLPELPPVVRRTDPATSHEAARKLERSGRRTTQLQLILERLQRGPATSAELAAISLKYTGRISDLRAQGFVIECVRQGEDGVAVYRLGEGRQ